LIHNKFALDHRADAFGSPSDEEVFVLGFLKYIPIRILDYIVNTAKNPRLARLRETGRIIASVAKQMVKDKAEMLMQGEGSRDVFSLLGECTPSFPSSRFDKKHS
jgi:hypothetical protein